MKNQNLATSKRKQGQIKITVQDQQDANYEFFSQI